jgi:hypothetical protein
MDTILPYVFWITASVFRDWLLRQLILRRFRWYVRDVMSAIAAS